LIVGLALLSASPWLFEDKPEQGAWVRVKTPEGEYRYRLSRDKKVVIRGQAGVLGLHILKGGIRVFRTGCPRKICKNRGFIRAAGERIICIPWRTEVVVEGRLKRGDVICR